MQSVFKMTLSWSDKPFVHKHVTQKAEPICVFSHQNVMLLSWKIDSNLGSWSETSTLFEQKNIKASKLVGSVWWGGGPPEPEFLNEHKNRFQGFNSASLAARYDNVPNPHRLFENSTTGPLHTAFTDVNTHDLTIHVDFKLNLFENTLPEYTVQPMHPPHPYTGGCYSGQLTLILRKNIYLCAAYFSLLNLPKGKSLGRSKPATNS